MKKSGIIFVFALIFAFCYGTAYSAIVVESVKGDVAVREGSQWKPLQKGQTLAEGSKISTGVRSEAVLKIDGSTLTVRPLTMMKIYRNRKINKIDNTHIGLKYGKLNARVQRIGKLKTSFKISTPVATSSVRGTDKEVGHGAKRGTKIEVPRGSAEVESQNGGKSVVSGNQSFEQGTDSTRSENLLSDAHNDAMQPLYDPNNDDEKPVQGFVSDDITGSGSGDADAVIAIIDNDTPTITPPAETNTNVNIDIQWP